MSDHASSSSNGNPQAGQNRPLPKKESDSFRNVVKFYESKHYKKGLKNADAILRRFPNHGETLCMKGLIVNAMAGTERWKEDPNKAKKTGGGGAGGEEKDEEGDKKKEAVELVKRGLMMDMRSHVCWHVYGLLHRSSHNYAEAVKAYKQALKIDPENLQILRDMGLLQIQVRDLRGFRDTRLRVLTLRPNSRAHWLTYAVACHANGDPKGTVGVLDGYLGTVGEDGAEFRRGFESSELAMYRNRVLAETKGGEDGLDGVRKALEHLDEVEEVIVDRTGWLAAKLSHQLKLGRFDDANKTAWLLFERGCTEDHRVHGAYMCALLECDRETCEEVEAMKGTGTLATLRPLDDREREVLLSAYEAGESTADATEVIDLTKGEEDGKDNDKDEDNASKRGGLARAFPKSVAVKRIRLTLLAPDGDEFKDAVDDYCRRQIVRGVPSLGADLSAFYLQEAEAERDDGTTTMKRYVLAQDPVDVRVHPVRRLLVELADSYVESLASRGAFPGDAPVKPEEGAPFPPPAPPSALLWAWYLRSILHEQVAEHAAGLALIEKCVEHTPTAVDFYELRARLLEGGGDVEKAAEVVDAGRDLDRQDRYINNRATMTLLRAGREEDARKRIAMFTRHEGDPERNLYDMQCTWYELEVADCWRRRGEWGKSLRKYMAVIKHYEDFHEDQFDFHMYCIRKVTLRSYCRLLDFEDKLWGLPHYGRAAEEVVRIHLRLLDNPAIAKADEEPDYSKMTPAERKKAKNIARKKKKAAAASGGKNKGGGGGGKDGANGNKKKQGWPHALDEDPEGKELLAKDHLDEARKYAAILARHAPGRVSSWALQYDVSVRRGKMLLALQALYKMKKADPDAHQLFSCIVDFSRKLSSRPADDRGHASSEAVISGEFPPLMSGKSLEDFVKSTANDVRGDPLSSLPMRVAVAKALISTEVEPDVGKALSLILDSKLNVRCVTVETCREALQFVESLGAAGKGDGERLKALIAEKFPFAKDI